MYKNYLKIAIRNLVKNRVYSFINIAGLGIGISVSVLILMFVMHEFSYDKFYDNHERIFRVTANTSIGDRTTMGIGFHAQFGPTLKENNPQIQEFVRVYMPFKKVLIKNPERPAETFFEDKFLYADPSFFNVFSFTKQKSEFDELSRPFTMVISKRAANKYFGDKDPIGKTLIFEAKHPMQIVGVVENPPSNSTFDFNFVASLATYPQLNDQNKNDWEVSSMLNTYLLLDSEKSFAAVTQNLKRDSDRTNAFTRYQEYFLDPLASIHLGNNFYDSGNNRLINIFIVIAVLILALALFNYMSLATALATTRAKEVGVRKVIGAARSGLIKQFYVESILICTIAFICAFILIQFLKDPFYNLLGLEIDTVFLFSPSFVIWIIALLTITVILAGSYPALILSGFAPLKVLKGNLSNHDGSVNVRRLFTILQITVSIALIISSLVIKNQLSFMQNKNLGFYKDQVLCIPLSESAGKGYFAMRNEIRDLAGTQNVSITNTGFFKPYTMWSFRNAVTKKDVRLTVLKVDRNFAKTLALQFKIAPDSGTYQNKDHFLINEEAVKELDLKGDVKGQKVMEDIEVAGVVRDFNFQPLQNKITPLCLYIVGDSTNLLAKQGSEGILYVKLDPQTNILERVTAIGKIFKKYDQEKPFEYYFLEDAFNGTFKTEVRLSDMFTVFATLAIFIACMGLFGLVTFTAQTRTKEIGIRKVLGASVAGIVVLLSRDLVKLVGISIILALPVAWYFMDKWLEDFAYRIQIPIWIYAVASLAVIAISMLTVSYQSIKAALMNPVKSLKSE